MVTQLSPKYKLGPAMKVLSERRRAFVVAMIETGGSNHSQCARLAGYEGGKEGIRVMGYRLAHDPKVLAALREETDRRIKSGASLGARVLTEVALDRTHKDRFKAGVELLNRAGLQVASQVNHNVNHTIDIKNDEDRIKRIVWLAQSMNMNPEAMLKSYGIDAKLLEKAKVVPMEPVIDAEYVEVATPTDEGLEDLL